MTVERKRIFVLVKTYPTVSRRYRETVCTAGILEDGTWIRLYPVPFRLMKDEKKYKKYTWINVDVEKNNSDFRIESYRPDISSIAIEPELPKVKGCVDWETRRRIILGSHKIYTNLSELISEAKETKKSLAVFRPSEIISLDARECPDEWSEETLSYAEATRRQQLRM